jgi:hypothetical protein
MNDARIYKTNKRSYVSKDNPTKLPEVGSVVATAYEQFKADDGYGPTEIRHYKVLNHCPDGRIHVQPLDKHACKLDTTIPSEVNKYSNSYRPIFED